MARLRRELSDTEAEFVESRQRAKDGYAPGRYFWRSQSAFLERKAAELRQRIPEGMR